MILAMNIGNTNFVTSWKQNSNICTVRYKTNSIKSYKCFLTVIEEIMIKSSIKNKVTGVVLSSVVPALTSHLEDAIYKLFDVKPIVINSNISMNLNLNCYDKNKLGTDRIAICEGAIYKYKSPIIIFDFGTATTINVIDKNNSFLGGSILTGLTMGLDALSKNTAQLKTVNNINISSIIGTNTNDCLISGAIYGNASMLDGMVQRINQALMEKSTVLITGGNAQYILTACQTKVIYEPNLLIEGLYALYNKNITTKTNQISFT